MTHSDVSHVLMLLLLPHTGCAMHVSTFLDVLETHVVCMYRMLCVEASCDVAFVAAFTVHAAFQPNMPSLYKRLSVACLMALLWCL